MTKANPLPMGILAISLMKDFPFLKSKHPEVFEAGHRVNPRIKPQAKADHGLARTSIVQNQARNANDPSSPLQRRRQIFPNSKNLGVGKKIEVRKRIPGSNPWREYIWRSAPHWSRLLCASYRPQSSNSGYGDAKDPCECDPQRLHLFQRPPGA